MICCWRCAILRSRWGRTRTSFELGQVSTLLIERQHSEIDQVVTAIKQMACSVEQITRNATTTAAAAQRSHGAAQESGVVTAGRQRGATVG